ncbi:MAG: hypothetical protein RIQ74_1864 [Pseudomonadota bacterium]|jgi:hypothetical protein
MVLKAFGFECLFKKLVEVDGGRSCFAYLDLFELFINHKIINHGKSG